MARLSQTPCSAAAHVRQSGAANTSGLVCSWIWPMVCIKIMMMMSREKR